MIDQNLYKAISSPAFLPNKYVNMIANEKDAGTSLSRRRSNFITIRNEAEETMAKVLKDNYENIISAWKEVSCMENEIEKMQNILTDYSKLISDMSNLKLPVFENDSGANPGDSADLKEKDLPDRPLSTTFISATAAPLQSSYVAPATHMPSLELSGLTTKIANEDEINEIKSIIRELKSASIEKNFAKGVSACYDAQEKIKASNLSFFQEQELSYQVARCNQRLCQDIVYLVENASELVLSDMYSTPKLMKYLVDLGQSNLAVETYLKLASTKICESTTSVESMKLDTVANFIESSVKKFFGDIYETCNYVDRNFISANYKVILYNWVDDTVTWKTNLVARGTHIQKQSCEFLIKAAQEMVALANENIPSLDIKCSYFVKKAIIPHLESSISNHRKQLSLNCRRLIKIEKWQFTGYVAVSEELRSVILSDGGEQYYDEKVALSVAFFCSVFRTLMDTCEMAKRKFIRAIILSNILEFISLCVENFVLAKDVLEGEQKRYFHQNMKYIDGKVVNTLETKHPIVSELSCFATIKSRLQNLILT